MFPNSRILSFTKKITRKPTNTNSKERKKKKKKPVSPKECKLSSSQGKKSILNLQPPN
jgi:hypothetical protein